MNSLIHRVDIYASDAKWGNNCHFYSFVVHLELSALSSFVTGNSAIQKLFIIIIIMHPVSFERVGVQRRSVPNSSCQSRSATLGIHYLSMINPVSYESVYRHARLPAKHCGREREREDKRK